MNDKHKTGFASMDPEQRRRIQSQGGKAAQAKGTGNRFTSETAREAGRKGGASPRGLKRGDAEKSGLEADAKPDEH